MLEQREPQVEEDVKHVALIKGSTASEAIMKVMRDLHRLKKPNSVLLSKKNAFRPFEDATGIEFLTSKSACGLFAFASHSKKRPNNLVLGRIYDDHILDMFEFGVQGVKLLSDFKNSKISMATKPLLLFAGEVFDSQPEYIRLKNFLTDFFSGHATDGIRLAGIESVISIVAIENKIFLKHYRAILLKSGTTTPRVELEEIGPSFELMPRRRQLASDDLFKRSLKQAYQLKPKKPKNVSVSKLGTTYGRVHVGTQDFKRLATKQVRSGKKRKTSDRESGAGAPGDETAMQRLDRLNPIKKQKQKQRKGSKRH